MPSVVDEVRNGDVQTDATQRENVFDNGIPQRNSGLQRDINIIQVQPQNFTNSEMRTAMPTSEMKNVELLSTRSGDFRTAKSHTRTVEVSESDVLTASNAPHKILVSSISALNCDEMNSHLCSLPQAQSDPHSHSQPIKTFSKPLPHPINHAENGHYNADSSMLNSETTQAMCSSPVSTHGSTGTLQAVKPAATVDPAMTPLSLSIPSTLPLYHKITSYSSSTVSGNHLGVSQHFLLLVRQVCGSYCEGRFMSQKRELMNLSSSKTTISLQLEITVCGC